MLDVGSGCGASAIACVMSGAKHVIANDVDTGLYQSKTYFHTSTNNELHPR